MKVKVVKWGNSRAVRLPAAALKEVRIALGDFLELKTADGKIVLEPTQREYQLEDLLGGISVSNLHTSVDFGAPVGREAW